MVEFLYSFYLLINIVRLNFAQVNFANCFRGYFSDFMRRIASYLTNKIGKTDRKQTQKNLIEYYFIGKFKRSSFLATLFAHRIKRKSF